MRSAVHTGKRSPEERTETEGHRRSPEKPTRVRGKEEPRRTPTHFRSFFREGSLRRPSQQRGSSEGPLCPEGSLEEHLEAEGPLRKQFYQRGPLGGPLCPEGSLGEPGSTAEQGERSGSTECFPRAENTRGAPRSMENAPGAQSASPEQRTLGEHRGA